MTAIVIILIVGASFSLLSLVYSINTHFMLRNIIREIDKERKP